MTKYVLVLGIELLDLVNESLTRGVLLLVNLMGDSVDFDNIKKWRHIRRVGKAKKKESPCKNMRS